MFSDFKLILKWAIWGLIPLAPLSAQDAPQAFSVEEAVAYAQKNGTATKKALLDIAAADAQVKEYTAIGLPQVNGKVEYQHFFVRPTSFLPDFISPAVVGILEGFRLVPQGTSGSIPSGGVTPVQFGTKNNLTLSMTASALVFDGSYLFGLKAAKGLREMTKKQADLSDYTTKYNVKKAYLTVLIIEENKKVLLRNIQNLQKLLTETEAFYKGGFVEQLDVDRLQLSVSNLQTDAESVSRQVELAYNVLKFQMDYDINKPIVLTDSLPKLLAEPNDTDLKGDIPYENRIEMDILKRTEMLNELNVKVNQFGYAPNLTAFMTVNEQLQRNKFFSGSETGFKPTVLLGVAMNVPIFDGFSKQAKIQKAQINQKKFQLEIETFRRAMNLEVVNARTQYTNAKQRLANQLKNLELAEKILARTKTKYKEGVGNSIEITTAEQELYRTQANYMNALYDLVVAKTDLDKSLGK